MKEPDRFDRLTPDARRVLVLAQEEARRFNHNYIGTEHLLLGLVSLGKDVTSEVFRHLSVELEKVRGAVEFIIGRGDRIVLGEVGLTPRAQKVLALAFDEARRMQQDNIGPEHLLLGLVSEGEGIAAGVLESLGVNLWKARHETYRVLGLSSPEGEPEEPPRPEPELQTTWSRAGSFSFVGPSPFTAMPTTPLPFGWAQHYRPWHIDAARAEKTPVGTGTTPRPVPGEPQDIVLGTVLGWVIVNTGGAFTLALYDGLADDAPALAVIHDPPTGAFFPFHCHAKEGLTYTLEGTPGSVTIIYSESRR